MWSSVESREIRVFLVLCEELHFGRTADRLLVTPSRVSQTIRELEGKLGGELLFRTSRRVELTPFGEQFRNEVRGAYEELIGAVQRAQAANGRQTEPLHLGLFSDPGASQIPRIVKAFQQANPESTVEAAEVPLEDPFAPLHKGAFDLVSSWLPHGQQGLVEGPILSSEPRVLAVSSDHRLARQDELSIEDVADFHVMRFETMPDAFNEEWIPSKTPSGRAIPHLPFSEQSVGDRGRMTNELVYQIATGRVVHPTVPSFSNMFGHPDVVYIPITDMAPLRSALVWRSDNADPRVTEFASVAVEVVADSAELDSDHL